MAEHIKITTKIKMNTKTTVKLFWQWPENNQLKSHDPGVFVGPIIFIMQIPPKTFQIFDITQMELLDCHSWNLI